MNKHHKKVKTKPKNDEVYLYPISFYLFPCTTYQKQTEHTFFLARYLPTSWARADLSLTFGTFLGPGFFVLRSPSCGSKQTLYVWMHGWDLDLTGGDGRGLGPGIWLNWLRDLRAGWWWLEANFSWLELTDIGNGWKIIPTTRDFTDLRLIFRLIQWLKNEI